MRLLALHNAQGEHAEGKLYLLWWRLKERIQEQIEALQ